MRIVYILVSAAFLSLQSCSDSSSFVEFCDNGQPVISIDKSSGRYRSDDVYSDIKYCRSGLESCIIWPFSLIDPAHFKNSSLIKTEDGEYHIRRIGSSYLIDSVIIEDEKIDGRILTSTWRVEYSKKDGVISVESNNDGVKLVLCQGSMKIEDI